MEQTNSVFAQPKPVEQPEKKKEERPRRSRNGGLIALVIISLLIGSAGLAVGIVTLLTAKNQPVATSSSAGYYTGGNAIDSKKIPLLASRKKSRRPLFRLLVKLAQAVFIATLVTALLSRPVPA